MTFVAFNKTLLNNNPPQHILEILQALWYDAKGDWESAQEGVQEYDRIRAYLHRKEGDDWNTNYWYRRAKTTKQDASLSEKWNSLVTIELSKM